MAVAFVQSLGSNQSKTAGTSLVISPTSKTVTVGNLIMVGFAIDDIGSAFGCTDNLGNTYTLQQTQVNSTHVKTLIFTAPVTTGGSLTTVTVSWTTSATAKAGACAEYSGVGTLRVVDGFSQASSNNQHVAANRTFNAGELLLCAAGYEDNFDQVGLTIGAPALQDGTSVTASGAGGVGGNGTTGGSSASNITCYIAWAIPNANSGSTLLISSNGVAGVQNAANVAIFNAAVTGDPYPAGYRKSALPTQLRM